MKPLKIIIPCLAVAVLIGLLVWKLTDHSGEFRDALYSGDVTMVEELLKAHPSLVNTKDMEYSMMTQGRGKSWTALHVAAAAGNLEMTKVLLKYHANVDARDKSGMTPLLWTTMGGRSEVAAILLSNGADINAHGNDGHTTLELAKISQEPGLVELLRQRGAKE